MKYQQLTDKKQKTYYAKEKLCTKVPCVRLFAVRSQADKPRCGCHGRCRSRPACRQGSPASRPASEGPSTSPGGRGGRVGPTEPVVGRRRSAGRAVAEVAGGDELISDQALWLRLMTAHPDAGRDGISPTCSHVHHGTNYRITSGGFRGRGGRPSINRMHLKTSKNSAQNRIIFALKF